MKPKTITVSYDVVVIPHDGHLHCSTLCPHYKDDYDKEDSGDYHKTGYCKMFHDTLNSFASLKECLICLECEEMLKKMKVKKPAIKRRKWQNKPHPSHHMSRYYLRQGLILEKPAWCRKCTVCHGSQQEFKSGGIKYYSSGLDSPCVNPPADDDIPDDY
jgi:hypothetical protein